MISVSALRQPVFSSLLPANIDIVTVKNQPI